MSNKNTGKEYEKIVAAIHRQFSGNATITEDEKIKGTSGIVRQIDIAIRAQVVGYSVLIIVQCKDYKRKVDIEKVDSLIGTLSDVSASKGILVSDSGFTSGAVSRAKRDGRVDLVSVVDVENDKLRSKLKIPVLAEVIGVTSMQMVMNETGTVPFTFDIRMLNEAKDKFASLWNKEVLPSSEGDNEYPDVLIDSPQQHFELVYKYTVVKKSYFKEIGLQSGSGIYNVMDGSFKTKSITTELIVVEDVLKNWPAATEKDKKTATFGFVLYSSLPETNF